jgi:hypothetical protein
LVFIARADLTPVIAVVRIAPMPPVHVTALHIRPTANLT